MSNVYEEKRHGLNIKIYQDADGGALSEARNMADWHYKEIIRKRIAKTKAYIRNSVPLMVRGSDAERVYKEGRY